MNCKKCGSPIGDGMRFCMNCGAQVESFDDGSTDTTVLGAAQEPQPEPQQAPMQEPPMQEPPVQEPPVQQPPMQQPPMQQPPQGFVPPQGQYMPPAAPQPKKSKKGLVIGLVAGALVFVGIIVLVISLIVSASKVKANEFIYDDIYVSGYDGYAYVSEYDVVNTYDMLEALGGSYYYYSDDLYDYITVTFDKSDYLSNGDTITATIDINYNGINSMGFSKKLSGKSPITKTYKISGLTEMDVFDPYDAVKEARYFAYGEWTEVVLDESYTAELGDCSFSVSDNEIDIYCNGSYVDSFSIYSYENNYTKSGKIKLEISCSTDYYADAYGFVIAPEEKDVDPVIYDYLMENSVNDADFKALKAAADKKVAADSYYTNPKYYGAYFACNDPDAYDKNAVILIYSYDSNWEDGKSQYMAYRCEDFQVNTETGDMYFYSDPDVYEYAYGYDSASDLFKYIAEEYTTIAEELVVK